MKICFEYENNQIVVSRGIMSSELYVNSKLCDSCLGFTNNQLKSIELKTAVCSNGGNESVVRIYIEPHLIYDVIRFYYSDVLIETRKIDTL